MLRAKELATAWRGKFYRSCEPKYAQSNDLVTGQGSFEHGGRWNGPGTCRAVYGSFTPEVALQESLAALRRAGMDVAAGMPRVTTWVEASVVRLDLTDAKVLKVLGIASDELTKEHWRAPGEGAEESLTEALGRAAYAAGLEALEVPSAAVTGERNLVVFPANLPADRPLQGRGIEKA